MNRWWLFIMILWFIPIGGYCQIDSSDMSQPSSPFDFIQNRRERFDDFDQLARQRYRSVQDSANQLFAQELAKRWKQYELHEGFRLEHDTDSLHSPADPSGYDRLDTADVIEPSVKYEMGEFLTPPDDQMPLMTSAKVDYLATRYHCFLPKSYPNIRLNNVMDYSVSQFWCQANCPGMEWFVDQCRQYKAQLNLNDWAMFDFVGKLFSQQFPDQYDAQTVMTVFVLNQLGIRVKVGRTQQHLVCLIAIDEKVYNGVPFYTEKGCNYYAFSLNPSVHPKEKSVIEVVEADFILADHKANMRIQEPMRIAVDTGFWIGKYPKGITVPYNKNMKYFYGIYPCVDLQVYLNASHDPTWAENIRQQLSSHLAVGFPNQVEKVGELMKFIRLNFDYISDIVQFNRDKYFFCEENFFYKGDDCEDRSVLLAYLVHEILGLDVVLLAYPLHVVTAIHFTEPGEGRHYINHKGKRYIICDPTVVGKVGDLGDQYVNKKPEIIELD